MQLSMERWGVILFKNISVCFSCKYSPNCPPPPKKNPLKLQNLPPLSVNEQSAVMWCMMRLSHCTVCMVLVSEVNRWLLWWWCSPPLLWLCPSVVALIPTRGLQWCCNPVPVYISCIHTSVPWDICAKCSSIGWSLWLSVGRMCVWKQYILISPSLLVLSFIPLRTPHWRVNI